MQVGVYTGQLISCKVAKIHNSRNVIFVSLWPLVCLAQVQHSEELYSMSEDELERWLKGLVPSCIIQLCCWQKSLLKSFYVEKWWLAPIIWNWWIYVLIKALLSIPLVKACFSKLTKAIFSSFLRIYNEKTNKQKSIRFNPHWKFFYLKTCLLSASNLCSDKQIVPY